MPHGQLHKLAPPVVAEVTTAPKHLHQTWWKQIRQVRLAIAASSEANLIAALRPRHRVGIEIERVVLLVQRKRLEICTPNPQQLGSVDPTSPNALIDIDWRTPGRNHHLLVILGAAPDSPLTVAVTLSTETRLKQEQRRTRTHQPKSASDGVRRASVYRVMLQMIINREHSKLSRTPDQRKMQTGRTGRRRS